MAVSAEPPNLFDSLDEPISPEATNPLGDRVFHLVVRGIAAWSSLSSGRSGSSSLTSRYRHSVATV